MKERLEVYKENGDLSYSSDHLLLKLVATHYLGEQDSVSRYDGLGSSLRVVKFTPRYPNSILAFTGSEHWYVLGLRSDRWNTSEIEVTIHPVSIDIPYRTSAGFIYEFLPEERDLRNYGIEFIDDQGKVRQPFKGCSAAFAQTFNVGRHEGVESVVSRVVSTLGAKPLPQGRQHAIILSGRLYTSEARHNFDGGRFPGLPPIVYRELVGVGFRLVNNTLQTKRVQGLLPASSGLGEASTDDYVISGSNSIILVDISSAI